MAADDEWERVSWPGGRQRHGAVALATDRRALLVAALFYLLAAVYGVVREFGALTLRLAVTILIVGAALLLSAFWRHRKVCT